MAAPVCMICTLRFTSAILNCTSCSMLCDSRKSPISSRRPDSCGCQDAMTGWLTKAGRGVRRRYTANRVKFEGCSAVSAG